MRYLTRLSGALLAASFGLAIEASAQVVVSEIHYHPVEEPAFNADGTPSLDLADDVHEFVEIQNTGSSAVDLGGWKLSGAVDFTFPTGTTIAAGGFKVIAKNVTRLQTVYSISGVLGPYTGKLSNSGDTVRLKNAAESTVDSVTYSSGFPWAMSANALGAQDRFTGLTSSTYQYKGRSLQRVSATANSNDPANWLASPLTGPTPGAAQAVTRAVPQPVVVAQSRVQSTDSAAIVLAGNAVTVSCSFSSTADLSSVQLEWFVDDVNSTAETHTTVAMTELGGGSYTATIAGQTARSIIRYRFLANRGSGSEVVSPRADDPAISQVGASGARQPWHGYFVYPSSGRTTTYANYDLLISTTNLAQIKTNVQQSPARVTAASATGVPREIPYVAATAPLWDGTVPAVFSCDGVLYDVQIRFHGSRYHRSDNATNLASFKVHFPETQPFRERSSWFITAHGTEFSEATKLNRLLALPASTTRNVSWYLNSNTVATKLEQGEYDGEMLDTFHELQQQLDPGSTKEENGELYKCVGNRDASQSNLEGPYTCGDEAPMLANSAWTQLQRYEWNFSIQNNGWKGSVPIRDLMEGMWTARGDTPATHNFSSTPAKLATAKAWFAANFDIDATLTSMAMLQWMGIWDDVAHNQFFWRRANGKWVRLGWDYDSVMNASASGNGGYNASIYNGEYGNVSFGTANWWKDTFFKCYRTEFNQRLWELNNSFFDSTNLTALGFSRAATFAASRKAVVNTALSSLGTYNKPARPTNSSPLTGGTVLGGASLVTSAYSSPNAKTHATTKWEIRTAAGDYESPVIRTTSASSLTSFAIPFDSLVYGQTYWWRATHVDSDGHPSIVSAETSFTWGTASATAGTLVLNEILAVNKGTVENGGSYPDYIEIRNNGTSAYDLTGVTLTDDPATPGKYAFPSGNTVPAGAYLIVWCDDDTSAPGIHSGFGLDSGGQTVLMLSGATILDSVTFGPQAPDLSIGRFVNGTGSWTANNPTPGLTNDSKTLGTTATLTVNEWMASPAYGEDWFELYNSGTSPVALAGLFLSDTPGTPKITKIPALSYIGAGGFTRFLADGVTDGGNHCDFKLSSGGESLILTATNGVTKVHSVTFGAQAADVSQGALPDGGSTIVSFAVSASSEKPDWLPAPVVINEVLANPADGAQDSIELYNPTASAVAIGGWWLSDDFRSPKKYQIVAGTSLAAGGYLVLTATDFGAGTIPFALGSGGDEVCLSAVDGSGVLTGYRAQVSFDASAPGASFGRVAATGLENGRGGAEFWPQTAVTLGSANSTPVVTPVIVNEIMYHPVDGAGSADVTATEFIELHNPTNAAVDLSGWHLKGDSDFSFPSGVSLAPSGYLLLVGFDPADSTALASFRATYGLTAATAVYGPYSAKLANNTQAIEIARPVEIDGVTKYVNTDRIEYRDTAPWPTAPDGTGTSLQRLSRSTIGNDAANWASAAPTPGRVNAGLYTALAIWTESPLPSADTGSAYSFVLTGVGGTSPYTWSLGTGSLPAGLSIASNGTLSGTLTADGSFTFTVVLADSAAGSVSKPFTLVVGADVIDSDSDGMPDDWEAIHGLAIGSDDSAADADADGQSNLDEYLAGTDPGSSDSRFGITSISGPASDSVTIVWPGIAGKSYRIATSTDLVAWTPQATAIDCLATGPMQAQVPGGGSAAFFIRVQIEP